MKIDRLSSILLGLAFGLGGLLVAASPAKAQITSLGASAPVPSGVLGAVDYDDKHHVYLHTWEYQSRVWGRFVGADGTVLGASFIVSTHVASNGFAGRPKVAYSRGTSADEFLVLYVSDFNAFNTASNVFGQIVKYTGQGPTGGTLVGDFIAVSPLFSNSTLLQILDAVVFNPITSRFLVVWEEAPAGYEVVARHVGLDGSPAGDAWNVSTSPGSQGMSQVAFDSQRNLYLVAYVGDGAPGLPALGTFGRILDGNSAQPTSGIIVLGAGYGIEPSVAYLPARDGFIVAWTMFKPDRAVMARTVPSTYTDTLPEAAYLALDTPGGDGAASVAYDPVSRFALVAAMSDPKYIRGALLNSIGAPQTAAFVLGTSAAASGSYYPTVKPAEGGVVGLIYVVDYTFAILERFQLADGGSPPPPPPPPPPSCTIAISDNSTGIPGAAYSGALSISTGAGCDWVAVPQVPWLSVSTSSGSGPGGLQWTAQGNWSGAARSGTILIAGGTASRTLTVGQAAFSAPLGDFNADSHIDLIWQNRATGNLALWKMNGFNLMSGDSLNPAAVGDTGWKIVAAVDLDKDGATDLLWQHDTGYLAVWRMHGDTLASGELITQTPLSDTRWHVVGAGDIDRDGNADIVWQHDDGRVAVWYMRGTTYLSGEVIAQSLSDQAWRVVGVADMNGDGNVDLVWHHSTTGAVAVWLMNRMHLMDARLLNDSAPDTNWHLRGLGDFDGDGDVDVLWQNDVTGALAAWVMNGLSVQAGAILNMTVPDTNWKIVAPR